MIHFHYLHQLCSFVMPFRPDEYLRFQNPSSLCMSVTQGNRCFARTFEEKLKRNNDTQQSGHPLRQKSFLVKLLKAITYSGGVPSKLNCSKTIWTRSPEKYFIETVSLFGNALTWKRSEVVSALSNMTLGVEEVWGHKGSILWFCICCWLEVLITCCRETVALELNIYVGLHVN